MRIEPQVWHELGVEGGVADGGMGDVQFGASRQRLRPVTCIVIVSMGSKCMRVRAPG